ncbi:kinase-like domain-containing protein [Syncephalis plumigaleata]|nr:kinase-like domain-containing protein [Syncephalis plumigaleata]
MRFHTAAILLCCAFAISHTSANPVGDNLPGGNIFGVTLKKVGDPAVLEREETYTAIVDMYTEFMRLKSGGQPIMSQMSEEQLGRATYSNYKPAPNAPAKLMQAGQLDALLAKNSRPLPQTPIDKIRAAYNFQGHIARKGTHLFTAIIPSTTTPGQSSFLKCSTRTDKADLENRSFSRLENYMQQTRSKPHPGQDNVVRRVSWRQLDGLYCIELAMAGQINLFDLLNMLYHTSQQKAGPLLKHANRIGTIRNRLVIKLTHDLLQGLAFMHAAGLAHNDIKIDNAMLYFDNEKNYKLVIIDLDLATEIKPAPQVQLGDQSVLTVIPQNFAFNAPHGYTVGYAPPEMVVKGTYDLRKGDAWSAVSTVLTLKYGLPPFGWDFIGNQWVPQTERRYGEVLRNLFQSGKDIPDPIIGPGPDDEPYITVLNRINPFLVNGFSVNPNNRWTPEDILRGQQMRSQI